MVANGANGDFNPVSKNQRNIKIKLDHLPLIGMIIRNVSNHHLNDLHKS